MTCGYQTWQKGGLWLGVTCLTKSHPSDYAFTGAHVTNELHCIFTLRSLLPLNLAGWWLVKLKSRRRFNYVWFFVSSANFDSIEKIPPVKILFLKQLCLSINLTNFLKNICVHQVVLKIRVLSQEKNFWSVLR